MGEGVKQYMDQCVTDFGDKMTYVYIHDTEFLSSFYFKHLQT